MKRIIIFDFDGTIADTFLIGANILNDLSPKYGYKRLTDAEIQTMRDYTVQEMFKTMHVPFYKLPFMVSDVKKELNKQIDSFKPIKGMDALINELKKKGYQLGLITSNNKNTVEVFLRKNKLDLFDYIYTGTTIFGKARVILGFLQKHSFNKEEAVYIGDEIRDIEATKKVGISIIAVTWGFNSRKGLQRFQPEFLIDKPSEILSVLDRM